MCCRKLPAGGLVHQNSLKTRLKSLKNRLQIKTLNGVTRATGGRSLIGLRRVAFGVSPSAVRRIGVPDARPSETLISHERTRMHAVFVLAMTRQHSGEGPRSVKIGAVATKKERYTKCRTAHAQLARLELHR